MTCKDCIHNEVCYKSESVSDNYAEKCGDCLTEKDLQRPQGEWIRKVDEAGFISHICSKCGAEIEVEDPKDDKFCFNCGAKMQKGGGKE